MGFNYRPDTKAEILYHLKQGPIVVSKALLQKHFGYIWEAELAIRLKKAVANTPRKNSNFVLLTT
jgi:hypothetical protein